MDFLMKKWVLRHFVTTICKYGILSQKFVNICLSKNFMLWSSITNFWLHCFVEYFENHEFLIHENGVSVNQFWCSCDHTYRRFLLIQIQVQFGKQPLRHLFSSVSCFFPCCMPISKSLEIRMQRSIICPKVMISLRTFIQVVLSISFSSRSSLLLQTMFFAGI